MPPSSLSTASNPNIMDASYIVPREQDLRQCRSRSNSHLSSTAAQFQDLDIGTTDSSIEINGTSSDAPPPTILGEGLRPSSKPFIAAPVPQQLTTPFPLLSEVDFDPNSTYLNAFEGKSTSAPLLKFEHAQPAPETASDSRSFRSTSNPATMRYRKMSQLLET